MGTAHSHGPTTRAALKPKPKTKPKPLSLDAFVADLVKQMVERTVDGVIEEKQRKKCNAVENLEESRKVCSCGKSKSKMHYYTLSHRYGADGLINAKENRVSP